MKNKVSIIKITFNLTLGSLLLLVLPKAFCFGFSSMVENIVSGIFTGSFVALLITYKEYLFEKTLALESYRKINYEFLENFNNIDYLDIKEPKELLIACVNESNNSKKYFEEFGTPKKEEMKKWIWNNMNQNEQQECENEKNGLLNQLYENMMEKYNQQLEKIVKQYFHIASMDYYKLEKQSSSIYFIWFNNKKKKTYGINEIDSVQRRMFYSVKDKSVHFEVYYAQNKKTQANVIRNILELQEVIFEVDNEYVYKKYIFDIESKLFEFTTKVYKKVYKKKYLGERPKKKLLSFSVINNNTN